MAPAIQAATIPIVNSAAPLVTPFSKTALMNRTLHWEIVYQTKNSTEVSWYEPDPKQSRDLILQVAGELLGRVIDSVEASPSSLSDCWMQASQMWPFLIFPQTAIEATKTRLAGGRRKSNGSLAISSNARHWASSTSGMIGHISFHHQSRRPNALRGATKAISTNRRPLYHRTFAKGGPEKCSGLYDLPI